MTDLFCEFTVVNKSELTLHATSQTNAHGSWDYHGTHLIAPGEYGRFTAKDPAGAWVGSEGSVTFADDTGCTFTLRYCCSFGKGGNYAFVAEHSPLLDVTLRFGHEVPPVAGDKHWGSAIFPPNGHPLGILVYVEQRPVMKELTVLTYNAHLFEGSMAVIPAREKAGIELVFEDGARSQELLRRIGTLQPDVVCLQEVWALAGQEGLAEKLKDYPYVYLVADNTIRDTSWWEEMLNWLGPVLLAGVTGGWSLYLLVGQFIALGKGFDSLSQMLRNILSNTSGLLFLSKVPFRNGSFTMYQNLRDDDLLGKKGLIDVTLMLAADKRTPAYVRLGTTHCPTHTGDAQRVLRDVAAPKTLGDATQDRILLGDFNLHVSSQDGEYDPLNKMLAQCGARDLVHDYIPKFDDDNGYTEWQAGNSLTWALDTRTKGLGAPTRGKDRIDFVYFAPRAAGAYLKPKSVSIPHDWDVDMKVIAFNKTFDKLTVSDHYPVITRFDVAVPVVEPYGDFSVQTKTMLSLNAFNAGQYAVDLCDETRASDDADLYCVRRVGADGRMAVEVLTAASGYQVLTPKVQTRLEEREAASFVSFLCGHWEGRPALFALKKTNNALEVHVLDRATGYRDFLLQRTTALSGKDVDHCDFFLGQFNSETGRPDLFCLKRTQTESGQLELHVLSARYEYQRFSLQMRTAISLDDLQRRQTRLGVARFNRITGNTDVYCLERGTHRMNVRILDGSNRYKTMSLIYETKLEADDMENFVFRFGNCAEVSRPGPIYCLKRQKATSGTLEVHVLQRRPKS